MISNIHVVKYLKQREVVWEVKFHLYIHSNNSTIIYIVREPIVLDLEDPRLYDTSACLWQVDTIQPLRSTYFGLHPLLEHKYTLLFTPSALYVVP